jgi:nitroreductase
MYAMQQTGAAIENMLLKTTELGLATCWVGAFTESMVKRLLRLPEFLNVEALLPIGYEMGKAKSRKKPDINSMVFYDGYGDDKKYMGGRIRVSRNMT